MNIQCIHSTYKLHAQQPQKFIPPKAWIHEEEKDIIPGHFNHGPMFPRTPFSFLYLPLLCPSVFLTFGVWNSGHLLFVAIPFAVGMRKCWPRNATINDKVAFEKRDFECSRALGDPRLPHDQTFSVESYAGFLEGYNHIQKVQTSRSPWGLAGLLEI